MSLPPDSPRTLRITGAALMVMGGVSILQSIVQGLHGRNDGISLVVALGFLLGGFLMRQKGRHGE